MSVDIHRSSFPADPWVIARDRYLEDLTEEERRIFNAEPSSLEGLFYSASSSQRQHEKNSKFRDAVQRLQPLVAGIEQFGKALDVYSNAAPGIMSPLWGSIRVILHVSVPFWHSNCEKQKWPPIY